jgi:MFS transporter, UMF1 family
MSDAVPQTPKKGIWGWMLFDWAQQPFHTLIITFVFAPYFASAVVPDPIKGQELWGYAIGVGGFLIAVLSPILGALADATGPRKPWTFGFTIVGVAGCWLLWYAVPGMSNVTLAMVAVAVALIGVEFAAVFNNAMMPTLVPRSELGRLSGSAWGLGYLGGLVSLVIVLGFLSAQPETGKTLIGLDPLFGFTAAGREGDRASGPLTALWMAVFLIPMFLFTPDTPRLAPRAGAIREGLTELGATLKSLPRQKSFFNFLISSMIYRDSLNALYSFGGIYAAGVLKWSIVDIGIFGIIANITGAIGAWLGGLMDQRFGPKPVIVFCIVALSLACLAIISATPQEAFFLPVGTPDSPSSLPNLVFYLAGAMIGAAGGSIQAASRTLLVDQVPPQDVGKAFGLYALSGRATAFLGPLSIAWATAASGSQRVGVTPIIALFIVAALLLPMVRSATLEQRNA